VPRKWKVIKGVTEGIPALWRIISQKSARVPSSTSSEVLPDMRDDFLQITVMWLFFWQTHIRSVMWRYIWNWWIRAYRFCCLTTICKNVWKRAVCSLGKSRSKSLSKNTCIMREQLMRTRWSSIMVEKAVNRFLGSYPFLQKKQASF